MFFDNDDDGGLFDPDLLDVFQNDIYGVSANGVAHYGTLRSIPTHTEDGIPIRKLYVSNLPPKTTRSELFGVFAQYGFIKSCWLRVEERGPNKTPRATYAFVTYSNPADAHKALQAPSHEKQLKGRNLRISPADSWHQPAEDADGRVHWKPRPAPAPSSTTIDNVDQDESTESELVAAIENVEAALEEEIIQQNLETENSIKAENSSTADNAEEYTILDVLNRDCMAHILSYVPLRDLVRSERVSKTWQEMVQEYLNSYRTFKTSWWSHGAVTLTTAVLRRALQRLGPHLLRLHIDHHWSALNDRTAHTIGKFCPQLEELKIVGMQTKNWNPLIYGCNELNSLAFISCNKLTDVSLTHLVKGDTNLENLTIANNTHVTGVFLTSCSNPERIRKLSFFNCYNLQAAVMDAAFDSFPSLTCLKLDVCPISIWKTVPSILKKLPKLEELSLSEYASVELCVVPVDVDEAFCEVFGGLSELKVLNISRNIYITDAVLKKIASSCPRLEVLNVSSCNSRRSFPYPGVGDEGVTSICGSCSALQRLDVSYLGALTDTGVSSISRLSRLTSLVARGNAQLTATPFERCLASCHELQELDVCGCDCVSEGVVNAGVDAVTSHPRPLVLRVASTAVALADMSELPTHRLLRVDAIEDRSNPHLRVDFVDRVFDDSTDSFDDLYEDNFDDFLPSDDDDLYMDDDDDDLEDEYDGIYGIGVRPGGYDMVLL